MNTIRGSNSLYMYIFVSGYILILFKIAAIFPTNILPQNIIFEALSYDLHYSFRFRIHHSEFLLPNAENVKDFCKMAFYAYKTALNSL